MLGWLRGTEPGREHVEVSTLSVSEETPFSLYSTGVRTLSTFSEVSQEGRWALVTKVYTDFHRGGQWRGSEGGRVR